MTTVPKLFQPITIGTKTLQHRVALAPLTRYRATQKEHVPILPLVNTYYSQRATRPGTLLITEATFIAPQAAGYDNAPGIWSKDQIAAWKEITNGVHASASFLYLQLWALGRSAQPEILKEDGFDHVAPSPIPIAGKPTPRALTIEEIHDYIPLYEQAAKNVMEAGFDGVEIHVANGYLLDQFLQDVSNHRTDEYGGSIEARAKFPLEVIDAVVAAIGAERVAIRLGPWNPYQSMKMSNPIPQFSYLVKDLVDSHPDMAYIHVVEPDAGAPPTESNDFIRNLWNPRPIVSNGGYTPETGLAQAERTGDIIAFGRHFLANPDLPDRIEKNITLNPYDHKTFYSPGHLPGAEVGYIDYPFANVAHV